MISFTPRRTAFAPDAFFASLCSFFVCFLSASGDEIGLSARSRSS
jgi:hypothetical protein